LVRELYGFELEPEIRDWLDSLSDADYKRVDEVCGLLAETGMELGGPGQLTWKGRYGNCGCGFEMLRPGSRTGVLLIGGSCC
jgi:hypothetical protein